MEEEKTINCDLDCKSCIPKGEETVRQCPTLVEIQAQSWLNYVKSNDPEHIQANEDRRIDSLDRPTLERTERAHVSRSILYEAEGRRGYKPHTEMEKELWYMQKGLERDRKRKIKFGRGLLISKIQGIRNRFVTLGNTRYLGRNCWSMFVREMRRQMRIFEYAKVEHFRSDPDRSHLHFVYRGSYLDVHEMSRIWKAVSSSPIAWVKEVTRDEHGLWAYMDDPDKTTNTRTRWSYSSGWSPKAEQSLLVEFCCIKGEVN